MSVFKTKGFARFARRAKMEDTALCDAVRRAKRGLIDAELGGGVIKQRIARPGSGRSGGFRVIVFYQTTTRTLFIDGFAKNDQGNINAEDLIRLKELASEFLGYNSMQVKTLVDAGAWIEVNCDQQ